jgi:hypothetical protein
MLYAKENREEINHEEKRRDSFKTSCSHSTLLSASLRVLRCLTIAGHPKKELKGFPYCKTLLRIPETFYEFDFWFHLAEVVEDPVVFQ